MIVDEDAVTKILKLRIGARRVLPPTPLNSFVVNHLDRAGIFVDTLSNSLCSPRGPINQREEKGLIIEIQDLFKIKHEKAKVGKEAVSDIMRSDAVKAYDPILELWQVYKDQPLKGNIRNLCNALTGVDDIGKGIFAKFVVKALQQYIHAKANQFIPCFVGAKEVGKTAFCKHIFGANTESPVPAFKKWGKDLSLYFASSQLRDGSKDGLVSMVDNLGLLIDEYRPSKNSPPEMYREYATMTMVEVRRSYAHTARKENKRASFLITTNDADFLEAADNNRRFIPLTIKQIDWSIVNKIDMGLVWAEALTIAIDPRNIMLDEKETAWLNAASKRHEVLTLEKEVMELIELDGPDEPATNWWSTSQIKKMLQVPFMHVDSKALARELQRRGARSERRGGVNKYSIKKIN